MRLFITEMDAFQEPHSILSGALLGRAQKKKCCAGPVGGGEECPGLGSKIQDVREAQMQLEVMREDIKKGSSESRVPGTLTASLERDIASVQNTLGGTGLSGWLQQSVRPRSRSPQGVCLPCGPPFNMSPFFFLYFRFLICKIGEAVLEQS